MLCECCEENQGLIDCKECSLTPGEWRVLCEACSAFIHRGAFKEHQLVSPELKKKRDAVKAKMVRYKSDREWEDSVVSHLQGVRKDIEDRQVMYEDDIKKRITDIQQKLKQQGVSMISKIKELTSTKLEFLDNLSKQLTENVKTGKETETKMDNLIADIGEFERQMGTLDEEEIDGKLTYTFLDWDKTAFPKLTLPLRIDYSKIDEAASELKLEVINEADALTTDRQESKPSDVSLQSRIDHQGVFWIHVDFREKTLDQLLSISYDIRSKYMTDRTWKTYDKLEEKMAVGEVVYGLWNADNKWYRGRVEELTETHANVVFLDFGNSEKISFSGILPIGENSVSDLPFQALECSLFPEPKEIPLNVKFEFTDMIAGGPLHCSILGKKMFGAKDITHIELIKDMPDGSQLNLREYLEGRCSTKTKADMPFSSRDIRLLENPNAFEKAKSSPSKNEGDREETKEENRTDSEKVELEKKTEESTDDAKVTEEDENATPIPNGNVEHEAGTDSDSVPKKARPESPSDIFVECEEIEEVFSLPIPSVYPGESLKLYFDPRSHSLGRDGTFWAMLHRNDEQNAEWERFQAALNRDGEKADHCTKINGGGIVLANFRKNWHRAKIDLADNERSDKKKVKVRLTDQGISCSIAENQLRVMPMKYFVVPPQGIKCTIACVKIREFPKDSQTHFAKLVENKIITAKIQAEIGTAKETCLEVKLMDYSGSEPVNIVESLYERESNRIKRAQLDSDDTAQGTGMKSRRSDDEAWQDEYMMSEQYPAPAVQGSVEDAAPYEQEAYAGAPQDQYARPSQDSRSGDYRGERRNRGGDRNDRSWRSGGDGRSCYRCGDPSHYSKNCPNDGGRSGGPRPRRGRRT